MYNIILLQSTGSSDCYYYQYSLLDNEITSELFEVENFKPEKSSIRIMSTREKLGTLFSSYRDMKVPVNILYKYMYIQMCMYMCSSATRRFITESVDSVRMASTLTRPLNIRRSQVATSRTHRGELAGHMFQKYCSWRRVLVLP